MKSNEPPSNSSSSMSDARKLADELLSDDSDDAAIDGVTVAKSTNEKITEGNGDGIGLADRDDDQAQSPPMEIDGENNGLGPMGPQESLVTDNNSIVPNRAAGSTYSARSSPESSSSDSTHSSESDSSSVNEPVVETITSVTENQQELRDEPIEPASSNGQAEDNTNNQDEDGAGPVDISPATSPDGEDSADASRRSHQQQQQDQSNSEKSPATEILEEEEEENAESGGCCPESSGRNKSGGDGDDDHELQTQREELMEKFLAHCGRIRGVDGGISSSQNSYRERYRLTDLFKWFVDDCSRPFSLSAMVATKDAGGPLTFRKCLEKTGFKLPLSISFPPSQVVDLLVETNPERSLREALGGSGGASSTHDGTTDTAAHRRQFSQLPAANMTRFLYEIGYSLVSEVAYRGVLNKAMNELTNSSSDAATDPSAVERQAQIVEHVRRVYEDAKKQNQPFKLKQCRCPVDGCNFTAETQLQMHEHRRQPHKQTHRWSCALCMKFSSWSDEDIEEHYNYEHGFTSSAKWDPPPARAPCPLCDQDFQYKGHVKNHIRTTGECPMNVRNVKLTTGGAENESSDVLNLSLWPKVEEKRSTFGASVSQMQKAQQQRLHGLSANSSMRSPREGFDVRGAAANQGRTAFNAWPSHHNQSRVSDVVNLVAAGQGHIRSPQKPMGASTTTASSMSNLPRIFPAPSSSSLSVLRSTRSIQPLQRQAMLSSYYASQQQQLSSRPPGPAILAQSSAAPGQFNKTPQHKASFTCEICDVGCSKMLDYLKHLQVDHRKLLDKSEADLAGAAPLACSRCRDRFYSYEGLERHLLMEHNLVTSELLSKAQKRQDNGKCRLCSRIYAFNLLQHLVQDHQRTLCSAEIVYSCDVCYFQCNSYVQLELHLRNHHAADNSRPSNTSNSRNIAGGGGPTSAAAGQHNYTQASNALTMIAQRQQQQAMLLSQPSLRMAPAPSSAAKAATAAQQQQSQTAASILSAAMNSHKRLLPPVATRAAAEPPSKFIRMSTPGTYSNSISTRTVNPASLSGPSSSTRPKPGYVQQQASTTGGSGSGQTNNRKQLRYCCTPCDLKFISYEAVLKHWVERHLKPLRVPLCRIDKCGPCQTKLVVKHEVQEEMPPPTTTTIDVEVPTDGEETKSMGLKLDFELPELRDGGANQQNETDEVEILSSSSPREIICLD